MTTSFASSLDMASSVFAQQDRAVRALAASEIIVLADKARTVLVACAGTARTANIAFMIRHTSGFLQVALHEHNCDRLLLPEALPTSRRGASPAYGQCVTVDAAAGTTTGISAADRARTAQVLADPNTVVGDLVRPGHLVPVRVPTMPHGQHLSTATIALTLTDCALPTRSGAVFADLEGIEDPTQTATVGEAVTFARQHGLTCLPLPTEFA
jgi:3,4-dihydroxy 2-butanone 4-phosphate synthase